MRNAPLSPFIRLFPKAAVRARRANWSELGDQLRPDRDHPDEQADRRQRRRFFYKYLQHAQSPRVNIIGTLFLFCSRSQGGGERISLKNSPKETAWLSGLAFCGALEVHWAHDIFRALVESGDEGGQEQMTTCPVQRSSRNTTGLGRICNSQRKRTAPVAASIKKPTIIPVGIFIPLVCAWNGPFSSGPALPQ